jgi:hypothetical protein
MDNKDIDDKDNNDKDRPVIPPQNFYNPIKGYYFFFTMKLAKFGFEIMMHEASVCNTMFFVLFLFTFLLFLFLS